MLRGEFNKLLHTDIKFREKLYAQYFIEFKTAKEIAQQYDCSNATILNEIKRNGWIPRSGKLAQDKGINKYSVQHIQSYKELHTIHLMGIDEICRIYKISLKTLSVTAKKQGWFLPWSSLHRLRHAQQLKYYGKNDEAHISYSDYSKAATGFSNSIYTQHKDFINPYDLPRGINIHLDHRYSKYAAYHNLENLEEPLTIEEICHPCNLILIRSTNNLSKSKKCSITAGKLRIRIQQFNATFENPYLHSWFSSVNFSVYNYMLEFEGDTLEPM